jgi:hypothetical protein
MRQWINLIEGTKDAILLDAAPSRRRHSLYVTVMGGPELVIVRMPHHFVRGREFIRAILRMMKAEFGVLAKDVHIEGLADPDVPQIGDGDVIQRLFAAFNGSHDYFTKFHLYAWDEGTQAFVLTRSARNA